MVKQSRVEIIDALRGVAALSVCWYHFTNGYGLLQEGWLKASGSYGWLGIECFFVISGFVIPLSMYRARFILRYDWLIFLGKRILRLDPPYFVAIIIAVGLWYPSSIVPGFTEEAPNFTFIQLAAHIGYLNAFLGYDWVNPVFWTLAIEFQYYILIAVLYGSITAHNQWLRIISVLMLSGSSFMPLKEAYVFHFIAVFVLGIVTFQHYVGLTNRRMYCLLLLCISAISWISLGPSVTGVALATSLIITFVRIDVPAPLIFLGTISYSLYLFHGPLGGIFFDLFRRFAHTLTTQLIVLLSALVISIMAAYAMYQLIERPSQSWSARLKYKSKIEIIKNWG